MNIENEVREIIAEILEIKQEEIPEDALFVNQLGMDSLRALEILAMVEKKYKIMIPPQRLADMTTLRGVINVVKEYYEQKS